MPTPLSSQRFEIKIYTFSIDFFIFPNSFSNNLKQYMNMSLDDDTHDFVSLAFLCSWTCQISWLYEWKLIQPSIKSLRPLVICNNPKASIYWFVLCYTAIGSWSSLTWWNSHDIRLNLHVCKSSIRIFYLQFWIVTSVLQNSPLLKKENLDMPFRNGTWEECGL